MGFLPVIFFNQAGTISGGTEKSLYYPQHSISLIPLPSDPKKREEWAQNKAFTMYDITQVFTDYTSNPKARQLFTHLGGGIGDVLAFSAVAEYLRGRNLTVHCLPQHHVLFKWFKNQDIKLKGMYEPIFRDFSPAGRIKNNLNNGTARLRMEYAAIEAREVNWIDAMFARMGLPTPPGLDRPQLLERKVKITGHSLKKCILIQHRASCQIRSSSLADFAEPVRQAYPDAKLCVFESDCYTDDRIYADTHDINVIQRTSIEDYLLMLQAFKLVVATDSSATHFREGLGKPCLTAFGAMTAESRTQGYKYIRAFNVQSNCPHQPCFKHQMNIMDFCPAYTKGESTAKCQSGAAFREQLYQELVNYKP